MLRAGAASIDITPPIGAYLAGHFNSRQSTGIHDPLTATALVISGDGGQVALVGCDLIAMDPGVAARTRELIQEQTGIGAESVMIWATHTHAGPMMLPGGRDSRDEQYIALLAHKLAGGVKMAQDRMADSELSVAVGHEDGIAFNRRYRMRDGSTATNPGVGNPDVVEVAGPIDPDVGCLFVRRGGATRAVLVNYACHLDVLGNGNHLISADYPYYLRRTLAQVGLSDAVVLFGNGCCGNINHVNVFASERQGGFEHCEKMGRVLAGEALKCLKDPAPVDSCTVAARRARIELPLRAFSAEELSKFRAIAADDAISATDFRKLNARGKLRLAETGATSHTTEVQALRIGGLAIVGIPAEYFVEFGLSIKGRSPAEATFIIELANDCVGYVPTEEGFEQGAYEGQSARFAKNTGAVLLDGALGLLQELYSG